MVHPSAAGFSFGQEARRVFHVGIVTQQPYKERPVHAGLHHVVEDGNGQILNKRHHDAVWQWVGAASVGRKANEAGEGATDRPNRLYGQGAPKRICPTVRSSALRMRADTAGDPRLS